MGLDPVGLLPPLPHAASRSRQLSRRRINGTEFLIDFPMIANPGRNRYRRVITWRRDYQHATGREAMIVKIFIRNFLFDFQDTKRIVPYRTRRQGEARLTIVTDHPAVVGEPSSSLSSASLTLAAVLVTNSSDTAAALLASST